MAKLGLWIVAAILGWMAAGACAAEPGRMAEMPADVLRDKIRGGMLGQILGNLNGLPHEMKYIDEPGNVEHYTPSLPEGARTDDDTDFEWVYIVAMQKENQLFISPAQIAQLWRQRINKGIWCANHYARHLMDLGLEPPLTGSTALNPWAEYNISGQFLCETFALLAPGMPQTASRIGLNYTTVAIGGEPAQTTQLFCTMIASAFFTDDMEKLLDAGVAALDPKCNTRQVVQNVRKWHREHPQDWRATRRLLRDTYTQAKGGMRDKNGYELMTGSTVAALLYGKGDLPETLRIAFSFGWDADNSAATAGAIVGVMRGYRSMLAREWKIIDRYKNTTRDQMPLDETITSFADRVIDLAEKVLADNGGGRSLSPTGPVYRIRTEDPGNIAPLADAAQQTSELRTKLQPAIEAGILTPKTEQERARSAYLAICLDLAPALQKDHPAEWQKAIDALKPYTTVVSNIYDAPPTPLALALRTRAAAAGLAKPKTAK